MAAGGLLAGGDLTSCIASIPPGGMPAVLAVDPSTSSWSASAALAAGAASELEDCDGGPAAPAPGRARPAPARRPSLRRP